MTAARHRAPESGRVLIVDDSPANLIALGAVLKPLNVEVIEARSGREALDHVSRGPFAVALLDVQMPQMDGFELAHRLRKTASGAELPMLFLTAIHRDELYVKRGYAVGGADYMVKPFDADVLRARVKAFVNLYRQREELRATQVGQKTRERDEALARLSEALDRERHARLQAEIANETKNAFLATVSHELRTPLNAILGWSITARDMTHEPKVLRALQIIERNARSQMRLIEDMLDIGRIMSGKLRLETGVVRIEEPIRGALEAVRPAADAKGISLAVDVPAELGSIVADGERLQQIFWNLLSNAIKFAAAGGRAELEARRQGDTLRVTVRDDGEGIAAEFLSHVFEPFRQADGTTTRRHGGLGLGLAIVRQLVVAHGGTIVAESDGVGHGARFVVELPARPVTGAGAGAEADAASAKNQLDGVDVVVVDDDDEGRALVEYILTSQGALVSAFASAEEALRALEKRAPDVILSDLSMPNIDGMAFIRRVRALPTERGGSTPAIALTAHAKGPLTDGIFDAGFQAHVAKPVEPAELVTLVGAMVAVPKP